MTEKIERYKTKLERLREWENGAKAGPISIHLDPSNRCNLECKFCWQRSHERKGWINYGNELSEKKLIELVEEAADMGVEHWLMSGGGEPLIRTETTVKVMERVKELEMHGDMITNGTTINEEHIKRIVECEWDRVRFSVNAPMAEKHDFLVGSEGAFNKALKNIILFNEYKRKLGTSKPEIGFNTVINSVNYRHLHEIVELLSEIDGDLLNVQTIILYSEKEKDWTLSKEEKKELPKYIRRANKAAIRYNIDTNIDQYLQDDLVDKSNEMDRMNEVIEKEREKMKDAGGLKSAYCYEPWYLMTIRADGTVGSCRLFGDDGVNIQGKSLKDVWFGDYYQRNRNRLKKGEPLDYCSKCGSNEFLENKKLRKSL